MPRIIPIWEIFEYEVLDQLSVGDGITNHDVADWLDVTPSSASHMIQSYTASQRRARSRTKYVLVRHERTSRAVWVLGRRTRDARDAVGQYGSDVKCRLQRALAPDLERILALNPRARAAIEDALDPMIDGFVGVVNGMMAAVGWNGEGELS